MSVPITVNIDKVAVVASPFWLDGAPRARMKFEIDPELGEFHLDLIHHKYFGIAEAYAMFKSDVKLIPPGIRETSYGLAIMNSTRASAKFMDQDWVDVNQGEFYFTHNPGVDEEHRFHAGQALRMHFVEMKPDYVNEVLAGISPERNSPLWQIKDRVSRNEFAGAAGTVSVPAFHHIIQNMFNCPIAGPLGQLMLEGSYQQLLAYQFAMMGAQAEDETVNRRDREILYAVKDYLNATFLEEHSLLSISRQFGVNQNKLKTGFKALFGAPVITYLYDLRMDYARMLLLDRNMNVSEVAPVVGYGSANHFSTAFKRKFGISPSHLKQ
jgi:AraC-like DNA-binding protein